MWLLPGTYPSQSLWHRPSLIWLFYCVLLSPDNPQNIIWLCRHGIPITQFLQCRLACVFAQSLGRNRLEMFLFIWPKSRTTSWIAPKRMRVRHCIFNMNYKQCWALEAALTTLDTPNTQRVPPPSGYWVWCREEGRRGRGGVLGGGGVSPPTPLSFNLKRISISSPHRITKSPPL